ncbi:HCL587Cp [Eremothecium sinecaudum]|uniref:Ubiquinone biosynthesis monooxygenase COQ6, mitochondrial n=1 Tax=Eremothecium sinecaudum TaxID=45286 RepID=A0A120K1N2_9SACH|nr:HCL587Cp [Eremothecium sinecaudum]AMD19564.1 HCL587Cp [Eremothecium sinecaudum]
MFTLISRRLGCRLLATTAQVPQLTDVLIVGGGPAGLTLAAAIKQSPQLSHLSTTLVEAGDLSKIAKFYDDPPEQFHNRVINLNPPSLKFLEETVGAKILHDRMQLFDGLYVTDSCSDATLDMEKNRIGAMIEIFNIQSSVLKRIEEINPSKLDIIDRVKVTSITYSDENDPTSWPIVQLDNGQSFKTRLLVGADGKNSSVRKFSGIESRGWSYNRWGIVMSLKLEDLPSKLRGWQRFLPTGPIAHLPMPGQNAALTWSTTEPLSRLLLAQDTETLAALINAAFILDNADMKYYYEQLEQATISKEELIQDINDRIEEVYDSLKDDSMIDEIYPPRVINVVPKSAARFPLSVAHADTYIEERIALVGDAAHSTHPLAGQGLNMGQGDVESLVKALEKAVKRGLDVGSLLALEPYWADRYPPNNLLLGGADKLHKLYSTDLPPIVALRTLGVKILNKLGPLKSIIVSKVSDTT